MLPIAVNVSQILIDRYLSGVFFYILLLLVDGIAWQFLRFDRENKKKKHFWNTKGNLILDLEREQCDLKKKTFFVVIDDGSFGSSANDWLMYLEDIIDKETFIKWQIYYPIISAIWYQQNNARKTRDRKRKISMIPLVWNSSIFYTITFYLLRFLVFFDCMIFSLCFFL